MTEVLRHALCLGFLFLGSATAFQSSNGFVDPYEKLPYVNASGSATLHGWDLQNAKNRISGTWTYHLDVAAIDSPKNGSGRYHTPYQVYMRTSPVQDFQAKNLDYTGSAIILYGWDTSLDKSAQNDKGNCLSLLSQSCL